MCGFLNKACYLGMLANSVFVFLSYFFLSVDRVSIILGVSAADRAEREEEGER